MMSQEQDGKRPGAINRRDLLKAFSVVPAALLPVGTAVAVGEKPAAAGAAQAAAAYQRKVLNDHQWETIKVLSDLIIPADDRSGSATQAGVPEFIDDWLAFRGGRIKSEILGGLTWLDLECNRAFGHDFVDCNAGQQKQVLDRIAWPEKAAPEDRNYAAFFTELRDLVASGFYSSEMGVKDLPYLGNAPANDFPGCPPNVITTINTNLKKQGVDLTVPPPQAPAKG
jgi:gluconate 2-dehydrogenase gamma chain